MKRSKIQTVISRNNQSFMQNIFSVKKSFRLSVQRFSLMAVVMIFAIGFYSCEDDSAVPEGKTPVRVMLKSNMTAPVAGTFTTKSGKAVQANVQIDQFLVNIDEFEFELEDDMSPNYDDDEISVYGPWLVDLMSPNALNGINIATGQVPNDVYDEVEVDIDVARNNSNSNINNRSVYIEGTIDQTPFVFWYNDDFDFEIEFDNNGNVEMTGQEIVLMVEFQIPILVDAFASSLSGNVSDGNNNGIIEIGNNDPDGNNGFVDDVIDAMEDAFDVDGDSDDDDDYDDDDDDYDDDK